ncbi:universal stress protein [Halomonas heilongjiangensis]|uniref:UspA domain-containing protein n=1 Tax=Halomonas heilongjiangensis TaxID=1387883 RepID=A0A2N7TI22_9GAMM|nr:universal stress protein [Halomonas heilongjiangensis]PMR67835.1 hypothetical protein C1H66_17835 [Halomonas heilongjiangensis]PXX88854.1 hypothetical protein CR158_12440 [Halomonas heilongjiangensis]
MIQSMLLAVDGSPSAKGATRYASDLARRLGGTIHAIYVVDSRTVEIGFYGEDVRPEVVQEAMKLRRQTEQQLEALGESLLAATSRELEADGVQCHPERLAGIPAVRILEAAQNSDLIVMGRRGESAGLGDPKGLGEVAERVLRTAEQPVLLAGEAHQELTRILLGFDASKPAREAMVYAIELAQRLALPVTAVSVHHDETVARQRLDIIEHYAGDRRVKIDSEIRKGDPAEVILGLAEPGDLITIGAFGDGRIREWLLGSTTETILRSAQQPVLLHR